MLSSGIISAKLGRKLQSNQTNTLAVKALDVDGVVAIGVGPNPLIQITTPVLKFERRHCNSR